jgi:NADH:quinone reductase (non-electrogenic)
MAGDGMGDPRPRIVIVGAGFAGIEVARGLSASQADVTLVDRQNYHLFQPLLYQVATAALSPADIAQPVRRILRGYQNVTVTLGEVTGIAVAERRVGFANHASLPFDYLVLASGATNAYFGHNDWAEFAPGLKSLSDARDIRSRLLLAFERADAISDPAEKTRLMTFVVVGGGPSGVELAGSIAELARHTLAKDFRHIDPTSAAVFLLEAGPRILAAFPKSLSDYAVRKLKALGVTVRENCAVENIAKDYVEAGGDRIPVGLAIWAAGVEASALGRMLGVATDRTGRIKTNRDLTVPGLANVYALGDVALVQDSAGNPLPGLAQVAKQQGRYLGKALAQRLLGRNLPQAFEFHDRGNVAVIGRHAAIGDFSWGRLTGTPAWCLWALVHIYLLSGLQHRVLVTVQWLWRYASYDRGARLIVRSSTPAGGG